MKKRLLLIMAFIAVMISCSKDDEENTGENPTGGEIFTAQAVKIQIPEGTELTQHIYDGTLDGMPVKLVKAPGNMLVFYLPTDIATGNAELVIPALSNMTIDYNIQQTVLNGSADDVMESFFLGLDALSQNLDDSPRSQAVRHNIENFGDIYEAASPAEKQEFARIYQANKTDFDTMLTINSSRDGVDVYQILRQAVGGTVVLGTGVALIAKGVAIGATLTAAAPVIIGTVAVVAGATLVVATFDDLLDFSVIKKKLHLNGVEGTNNRNGVAVFVNNESRTVSFQAGERSIVQGDSGLADADTRDFFDAYTTYNEYAEITNNAVATINAEIEGASYNGAENVVLPGTLPLVTAAVTNDTHDDIQFSVSHPNLVLEESSLLTDGQIKLKFKITGTPSAVPIETYLNYSFDNGFSSFTGKFPIIVKPSLVGTWTLESFENGTPIGQYVNNGNAVDCPSIITNQYTMQSYTLVFTENTYSATGVEIYRYLNLSWNSNCTITENGEDTYETVNHSESGTYSFEDNTITLMNDGNSVSAEVTFIGSNKINIDGQVYVRQ